MKRVGFIVIIAGVTLAAVAPARAQDKAKVEQGAALFVSQKCTMCHAASGKGNPKGALDGVATKLKAADLKQWILDPEGMRTKTNATRTPAMKQIKLTPDQIDALVSFISSLKPSAAVAADAEK
jgi:mono/diheme cytochrome c family protein